MPVNQRLAVFVLLGALLGALFVFPPTNPLVESEEVSAILLSAMVLMSFSALLLEHFFARPMDVVAAGVSILLLLVPSRALLAPWGPVVLGFRSIRTDRGLASNSGIVASDR